MTVARFLDRFDVILLDMCGTFMFGHDRLGPDEDYYATYRALGGRRLDPITLTAIVRTTAEALVRLYNTPSHFDDFPSVREAFQVYGGAAEQDLDLLERLFTSHEIGQVPLEHHAFIAQVARTHRLGVVSNICAHPDLWLSRFDDSGVFREFEVLTFSSEGRTIKPSPRFFARALSRFPAHARFLFAGDSLERDIIPAKGLGLATAWIAPPGSIHPAADRVVTSLPDLAELPS